MPRGSRRNPQAVDPHPAVCAQGICSGVVCLLTSVLLGACGTAAPPRDAEYPALVFPSRLPPAQPSRPAPASSGAPPSAPAPTLSEPVASLAPAGAGAPGHEGAPPAAAGARRGALPDPEPLSERAQWSYPVVYDRGSIRVGQPAPVCLPRPQPTPRRIGRFAFELWLGRELVDRLRFDFPLLAAEEPPQGSRRPLHEAPRFAPGARVSVTLRVPASHRATSARVLDRATGESTAVPWPPSSADGVIRARPCSAAEPRAGSVEKPPFPSDAGR